MTFGDVKDLEATLLNIGEVNTASFRSDLQRFIISQMVPLLSKLILGTSTYTERAVRGKRADRQLEDVDMRIRYQGSSHGEGRDCSAFVWLHIMYTNKWSSLNTTVGLTVHNIHDHYDHVSTTSRTTAIIFGLICSTELTSPGSIMLGYLAISSKAIQRKLLN